MVDSSDTLIEWINEQLEEQGWSMRELARRAELAPTTISEVIAGKAKPGLEFCKGVARAFHVAPEDVLRKAGLLPYITPTVRQNEELLHYFTQLPPDDRQRLITMTRALYEQRAKYKTEDQ